MMPITSTTKAFIRISYLLPAVCGLGLLIYACLPHLFFVLAGEAHEDMSFFQLLSNTWRECGAMIDGATKGSANATFFSYVMRFFVILSWVCILLFASAALPAAVCSCVAFAYPPTNPCANRAKRWFRFFCPNRPLYVLANLAPLFPACFVYVLLSNYRKYLGLDVSVFYYGPPAWVITLIAAALSLVPFCLLIPAQNRAHMNLFQLYKSKKQ